MKHRSIVPAALGICFQTWYKIEKYFENADLMF